MLITNKNIYSVPDFDSEDDDEVPYTYRSNVFKACVMSEKQEQNLVKLGCSYNKLDEYKQLYLSQNPKCVDMEYDKKYLEFQQGVLKEREMMIQRQRQKNEEDLKKYKALMAELNQLLIKNEADQDEKFEEELKRQRKIIQDAIALDKKKAETESAEAKAKEKAKADKEKKELEEKQQKEDELKEKNEKAIKMQQSSATSLDGLEEYKKYYIKIDFYRSNIKPKLEDAVFRKQCFEVRKVIKRTVAQLQPSHHVILEKYNVMNRHLLGIKQQSEEAFQVMLNFLAKVFLLQVKQEIHATPHAAYFLARFAYLLCSTIPEFLDYLLGRLLKRCPYLIPQFHDDDPTLSHGEIKQRLRYVIANKEKKQLETFLQHAEGQKCYIMFYGALCQTLPDPGQPENPLPIKHAWIYLARICNMPPREITPFLIMGLLEVSAKRLLEAYPHQTPKVFNLLASTIIPLFPKSDDDGNVSTIRRLEMFLSDYFKTGTANCVPESLPSKV